MSRLIHDQVIDSIVREIIHSDAPPFTERLVNSYIQDILANGGLLLKSGSKPEDLHEYYLQEINGRTVVSVLEALLKTSEFKDSVYKRTYERLKALGDEGKSYGDLFTEIYEDEAYLNEIFVRLVEETEGLAITSAKQLQELTGITEIYGYWDEEKGETVHYGERKPTKKEAQEIAFKEIEAAFTSAMSYRYSKALEDILEAGGTYNDLLQVKPSYFNLPETWSGILPTDQYSSILSALNNAFLIGEPNTSVKPDLKTVAREIEAPYSVLMDAHKLFNKWKLQN